MEEVLAYLRSKNYESIPRQIRGMGEFPDNFITFYDNANDSFRTMFVGLDKNSCSSTAVAMYHCLGCGFDHLSNLAKLYKDSSQSFDDLPKNTNDLTNRCFFVFFTPGHKFTLLYIDGKGCILHSNSDSFTRGRNSGKVFDLKTYLRTPEDIISFDSPEEVCEFFGDMILARDNKEVTEEIFENYFGLLFKWIDPRIGLTDTHPSSNWWCIISNEVARH